MSQSARPEKLNRSEIADILRRNIELYKDEKEFIDYLVDLTIYLIEYQYDPSKKSKTNDDPMDDVPAEIHTKGAEVVSQLQSSFKTKSGAGLCPVCGSQVDSSKDRPCPGCGIKLN